jgi:hypothetical protein
MVNYGMEVGTLCLIEKADPVADDPMESMDLDQGFSPGVSGFGPNEFANALSHNLNSHGANAQKLFGKHGLLSRYQRVAQEKSWPLYLNADCLGRNNFNEPIQRLNGGPWKRVYGI